MWSFKLLNIILYGRERRRIRRIVIRGDEIVSMKRINEERE